jgi:hypothetical protein
MNRWLQQACATGRENGNVRGASEQLSRLGNIGFRLAKNGPKPAL